MYKAWKAKTWKRVETQRVFNSELLYSHLQKNEPVIIELYLYVKPFKCII